MYIKNLTLTYGIQTVFDDVSINIPVNEKVGIVGVLLAMLKFSN